MMGAAHRSAGRNWPGQLWRAGHAGCMLTGSKGQGWQGGWRGRSMPYLIAAARGLTGVALGAKGGGMV